jgi:calcineurin-like phosphoesterase
MPMKLLFIGDICGKPGRELIRRGLAGLVAHHAADFVIANVENAAAGFGITPISPRILPATALP